MNDMDRYPLTRQRVLDRLRGLRRSARKLRDKLREPGGLTSLQRHNLYVRAESLVTYIQTAIRMLDEAAQAGPNKRKGAPCPKRKGQDAGRS